MAGVRWIFVGDSLTAWWQNQPEWDETFAACSLNLGVAGDRTGDVLYRLQEAGRGGLGQMDDPALRPEAIVVMIGTNHLWDTTVDNIHAGQIAVLTRLRTLRPQARLVVNSVLPIGDAGLNRQVTEPVNRHLADVVRGMDNADFVDLYPSFVDDHGRARRDLFPDGVHLNRDGYRLWRGLLLPVLGR